MRGRRVSGRRLVIAAVVAVLAGCAGSASPSTRPSSVATTSSIPTPSASTGPTPVIVDTDMGADDVMALLYLLRDPTVTVEAIVVSGTGLAHSSNGTQVASNLLEALGAGDIPLGLGADTPMAGTRAFPADWRSGTDAGYGLALKPAPFSPQPGVDLLSATIGSSATPVTILTLGPLTDLGQMLSAEPSLAAKIAHVHVSGGAISVPGNVAAEGGDPAATAAEWNLWIDPKADDIVLRSGIPITLVPLDATGQLPLTPAFREVLAEDHAAAGADIVYELLTRSASLLAGNKFWDQLATVVLTDPSAATFAEARVKVVTDGAAGGSLVQDASGTPLTYAASPDATRFESSFLAGLRRGNARTSPFTVAGTLHGSFDGSTCSGTPSSTLTPGSYAVEYESTAAADTLFAVIRLHAGATWSQVLDFEVRRADP
ncbi:MAG TPA: nucleoside hydrolase, partial [Candidatus Deferrimicrobium sp.]|nr:nucleoside hydrolase [Candidatus Deferrimicrobium sp.]